MPGCGGCKAKLEIIHSNNLRRFSNERKSIRSERICNCPAAGLRGNGHRLVTAMPFAANLQLVYFLVPGLAGLINGIIYVLLVKKCPKIGTQFIIPMIYGLYFLFTGSVYVFAFFAILAVVNELIMLGGGYQSKIRPAIPHALTWMLNAMGSTLTMLLFRDSMVQSYVAMGMDAASADAALASLGRILAGPAEYCNRLSCRRSFVYRRICAGHENAGQTL